MLISGVYDLVFGGGYVSRYLKVSGLCTKCRRRLLAVVEAVSQTQL